MLKTLRSRAARIAIATSLVTAGLALAQSAVAADYCVWPNQSCSGNNNVQNLETALALTAMASDSDRIFLGANTYIAPTTGGYLYDSPTAPVEVIGAGTGQSIITGPSASTSVLKLNGAAGTSVHDVTIRMPQMAASNSVGLTTNGTARRIVVDEHPTQQWGRVGVKLDGGALEDSTVAMGVGMNGSSTGVAFQSAGSAVRDSVVTSYSGIESYYGGSITRSSITATNRGLYLGTGQTAVGQSVIRTTGPSSNGIEIVPWPGANASLTADGLTLIGQSGTGLGVFGYVQQVNPQHIDVTVANSVIRGFQRPLDVSALGAGSATVKASYNAYDPGTAFFNGTVSQTQSNITNVSDPGFANAAGADYHLVPGSPLIDAGDPASPQGLDRDGNPLVADGNGDGTARRDIGAFEAPTPPVAGTLPADPPPATSGDQTPASMAGAADTQAPLITGLGLSNKTFAVGRASTAIAALARGTKLRYSLSEAAKVTVTIKRVRGRTAGKLMRGGVKGANAIKFSGRIGKRALKPGRYQAVITAVDAAGNRSAAKRVNFRVVKG